MDKVLVVLFIGLGMAVVLGAFTGWLLMLVLGAVLQLYGLAGPGFFLSWALAIVLSIITNSNVNAE